MAHTYTHLVVHALFSTSGRRPILQVELRPKVFPYMAGIIKRLKGQPLLINGPNDHVHLLFVLPPTLALSDLMEKVKANSSKWVNEHRSSGMPFAWQTGYTAFSVSQSKVEQVRSYIANQEGHHRRWTYQEEVKALLKKHGIGDEGDAAEE
jgi:REP element-mobilizing transposase RayT